MANAYNGEMEMSLYFKKYPMKIDMGVIASFQTETGADFMHVAIKAINRYNESRSLESSFARAEAMTEAVSMEHAARLFYEAAHKMDKTVTFDEMQEAVLMEGPLERITAKGDHEGKLQRSYPLLFAEFVMFAALGVVDPAKKP